MIEPLGALVFALPGVALALLADRIAARWPRRYDHAARPVAWRTGVLTATGAVAFGVLSLRWSDPAALFVVGAYFTALLLLMATDLHQRRLPDIITLPLIPVALVLLLTGHDPLLAGKEHGVASGLAAGIGAPAILAISSVVLRGALGWGDVKLAVSVGLFAGVSRLFSGFVLASAASSVLLAALLLTHRIGRRSTIPFGAIIIGSGVLAALLP